jgi:hypothetical protein
MADLRLQLAVFEPPPGNLGEFDTKLVVYADGGVEVMQGESAIVLVYPRCEPTAVDPYPSHDFRHRRNEYCSWFDVYEGYPTLFEGPRRCPPHLPVFGVIEESTDER